MTTRTIAEKLASFEAQVVTLDAGQVQRTEMKRNFYAGAVSIIGILIEIADNNLGEDAVVEIIEGLYAEVINYANYAED